MTIIVIDTSGPVCGTAVMDEQRVYSEFTAQNRNTHSVNLMPMIEAALNAAGTELKDLDAVACVTGPGSFTGVRIGAATAKGLGMAWNVPLVAVPTLDAMAYTLWGSGSLICPIMDARRAQVYTALYRFDGSGRMERSFGKKSGVL